MYTYVHTCMYTNVHMYTYVYICKYIHMYTHVFVEFISFFFFLSNGFSLSHTQLSLSHTHTHTHNCESNKRADIQRLDLMTHIHIIAHITHV